MTGITDILLLCQAFMWVLDWNLHCQGWLASVLLTHWAVTLALFYCVSTYPPSSQFKQEEEDKTVSCLEYSFIASLLGIQHTKKSIQL